MSKTLAIYFSSPGAMEYPFDKMEYFEAYSLLSENLSKSGIDTVIVRADSYMGEGRFKNGWLLKNSELTAIDETIQADLIFNRDDKNTIPRIEDAPIINHPELDELCLDKVLTAERFPEISPKTRGIHSFQGYLDCVEDNHIRPQDIIVLKKNYGTEGRDIYIRSHQKVYEGLYEDWSEILVQEFIDSSVGIPGLVEGLHDLRVIVVDGEPYTGFIRIPAQGTFLANYSLGGTAISIDEDQVPQEVIGLIKDIHAKLESYAPSLYAADFMNSPDGYKLIELNSRPGMQHAKWSHNWERYTKKVAEMIAGAMA